MDSQKSHTMRASFTMTIQNYFAFIDSQNLNLSILREGWKLDFSKFIIHLKKRYGITKAFLFIGNVP